jgi:hypothetical protein
MKDFDLSEWVEQYKEAYQDSTIFPKYKKDGEWHIERDSCFKHMSRVIQERSRLLRDEFVSIGLWKATRARKWFSENSGTEIEKISRKIMEHPSDVPHNLRILTKLRGVNTPVASAILTVIFPTQYCIFDYRVIRALKWLSVKGKGLRFDSFKEYSEYLDDLNKNSISFYCEFLEKIRSLDNTLTPREIEMGLWKFDSSGGIL